VTVLLGEESFEITTLRREGNYLDYRHPESVKFVGDLTEDLSRRDFTVNAMALDPFTGSLHDPFKGKRDLEKRIIRAVGNPRERFMEDALRIMRAARFAATLEFEVERTTLEAAGMAAYGLEHISAERKREEMMKLLTAPVPSIGLSVLKSTEAIDWICQRPSLPEKSNDKERRWKRTLARVNGTGNIFHLRIASLLVDFSSRSKWIECLVAEKKKSRTVSALLDFIPLRYNSDWSDTEVRKHAAHVTRDLLEPMLDVAAADEFARRGTTETADELRERHRELDIENIPLSTGELAVDGNTLMDALGCGPGPEIGKIFNRLLEVVLENPQMNNRKDLVRLAKENG